MYRTDKNKCVLVKVIAICLPELFVFRKSTGCVNSWCCWWVYFAKCSCYSQFANCIAGLAVLAGQVFAAASAPAL